MKQNKKTKAEKRRLLPSLNCVDEIKVRHDTYATCNYDDQNYYGDEKSDHDEYNNDYINDESLSIDDCSLENFKKEQSDDRTREEKSDCKLPNGNNEAAKFVNSFQEEEDFILILEKENDAYSTGEEVIESKNNDEWDCMSLDTVLETSTNDIRNQDSYSIGSASNDWDAISSVGSVMSMYTWQSDTTSMVNKGTYVDALKKKSMHASVPVSAKKSIPHMTSVKAHTTNVFPSIKEDESYCNDDVGGYDERDGYKFSRGGKSSYRYGRQHKGLGARKLSYKSKAVIRKGSAPGGNKQI